MRFYVLVACGGLVLGAACSDDEGSGGRADASVASGGSGGAAGMDGGGSGGTGGAVTGGAGAGGAGGTAGAAGGGAPPHPCTDLEGPIEYGGLEDDACLGCLLSECCSHHAETSACLVSGLEAEEQRHYVTSCYRTEFDRVRTCFADEIGARASEDSADVALWCAAGGDGAVADHDGGAPDTPSRMERRARSLTQCIVGVSVGDDAGGGDARCTQECFTGWR